MSWFFSSALNIFKSEKNSSRLSLKISVDIYASESANLTLNLFIKL